MEEEEREVKGRREGERKKEREELLGSCNAGRS